MTSAAASGNDVPVELEIPAPLRTVLAMACN